MALFPVVPQDQKSLDAAAAWHPEGLVPRTVRALKKRFPDARRGHRRRARSVHQSRPGRPHRRDRLRGERSDGRRARQAGALSRRGGRGHRRAVGHDGRAHRRRARRARRRGLRADAHPRVLGQVRVFVLRTVPRAPSAPRRTSRAATSTRTRWTPPTATRRCGRSTSTSAKAPTW